MTHNNIPDPLPKEWFLERIGQRIRRIHGGYKKDSSYKTGLVIHTKLFAEYLFECQEREYRYEDFESLVIEIK